MAEATITGGSRLTLDCIVCGAAFQHIKKGRGRYPRFCSEACREAKKHRDPVRHRFQCVECGGDGEASKPSAKYCSKPCRTKAKCRRHDPGRKRSGKSAVEDRQCKACGGPFTSRKDNDRVFCGDGCRIAWKRATGKPPSFSVYRSKAATRLPRVCPDCGVPLEKSSQRCLPCRANAKAAVKLQRKERERNSGVKAARRRARKLRLRCLQVEHVNPLVVLARDGWKCQLCGIGTPKRLRGSYDDRAPEVDHIISIADGGEHSYANVQCACRRCNIAKSGRSKGQLRLFG